MKPPEEIILRLVKEWLRKAHADMDLAEHLLSQNVLFPDAIVFHCQQAAEKYLKSFLTSKQIAFPKTHDLEELLDLIETSDENLALSLRDIVVLTPYGVELRYPGDRPDAAPADAREAVELARQVREALLKNLPAK